MILISSGAMAIFWLSFGILFVPAFGIVASYSTTLNYNDGLRDAGFNADLGIYLVAWGIALFVILVCSIKTNITFVVLFTILDAGVFIFSASHFQTAYGNNDTAAILTKVSPLALSNGERVVDLLGWSGVYVYCCTAFVLFAVYDYV